MSDKFLYLGRNLRRLRLDVRPALSQGRLADLAGAPFTQWMISNIERGLQPSDPALVDQLARALNVSVRTLLLRPTTPHVSTRRAASSPRSNEAIA